MKIKETLSQDLSREYEVIIPSGEIKEKLNARLEEIGKRAKIPGFRPGKIPMTLLKQRYNNEALSQVLEDSVEKGVEQIIKEKQLTPALKPKVSLTSFEEEKDLIFKVNLEVLPVLKDINLDKLTFEKWVVKVPSQEVTEVIEHFAKRIRGTQPLKTLRKTKKGDIVIIDFEGFIEDKPIEGGSGKSHKLELGSGSSSTSRGSGSWMSVIVTSNRAGLPA